MVAVANTATSVIPFVFHDVGDHARPRKNSRVTSNAEIVLTVANQLHASMPSDGVGPSALSNPASQTPMTGHAGDLSDDVPIVTLDDRERDDVVAGTGSARYRERQSELCLPSPLTRR